MSREDEQLDAAEYVIGTLSGAERAAFEVLVSANKQAQKDVSFWERTFGSLNASVAPVIPGQHVWDKISALTGGTVSVGGNYQVGASESDADVDSQKVETAGMRVPGDSRVVAHTNTKPGAGGEGSTVLGSPDRRSDGAVPGRSAELSVANDNVAKISRSRSRWRWGAVAAGLAALAFGVMTFDTPLRDSLVAKYLPGSMLDGGKSYIAVVNTPDQPALIVKVNSKTGDVTVRSVGVERPDGKSLELWYVPEGQKAISVGLVGEGQINLGETAAKDGDLLAISVEPQGGSPTGTATGPIVYTGKLIEDVTAK